MLALKARPIYGGGAEWFGPFRYFNQALIELHWRATFNPRWYRLEIWDLGAPRRLVYAFNCRHTICWNFTELRTEKDFETWMTNTIHTSPKSHRSTKS